MFSGWDGLQGCAAGEFGGSVYFCATGEATKHNRWALCDIALGYAPRSVVIPASALSLPLERNKWEKKTCSFNGIVSPDARPSNLRYSLFVLASRRILLFLLQQHNLTHNRQGLDFVFS